ncbi:IclR family transcriptional regulator [uncultured Friedmanniella sp.]|uniref:IclR family transcriptional regulator n=1 Tax=uncultured Friedmanniella sp. TaxID=335381 RepID=UPI0035CAAAF7
MAESVQGAQVVGRVARVLRVVARHPAGVSAAVVAQESGLTRPTAHRLLSSLAAEGLLDADVRRTRWQLGPELLVLGTLAADRYPVVDLARPRVRALAQATGESAFLSVRRGTETVCLLREEGSFPVRSFVLTEGVRFPLGVASAGLAILAFAGDAEIDAYLATAELEQAWGAEHAQAAIRHRVAQTRRLGYAVNPGLIVEGSWGMGAAVFDAGGAPTCALSLTGIEPRFSPARRPGLGAALLEQAHLLSRALGHEPAVRRGR